MAADQRLERVKIARLRRRDKKPITGPDYHRVAAVTRNTASGRARRTGSRYLAACDPSLPAASTKRRSPPSRYPRGPSHWSVSKHGSPTAEGIPKAGGRWRHKPGRSIRVYALVAMATSAREPWKAEPHWHPARREAFEVYRDLGAERSYP